MYDIVRQFVFVSIPSESSEGATKERCDVGWGLSVVNDTVV